MSSAYDISEQIIDHRVKHFGEFSVVPYHCPYSLGRWPVASEVWHQ